MLRSKGFQFLFSDMIDRLSYRTVLEFRWLSIFPKLQHQVNQHNCDQSPGLQACLPPKVNDALGVAVVKYDLKPLQVQLELTYAGERFVMKRTSIVSADW